MRDKPMIPKLSGWGWWYHTAKDPDTGYGDGSIADGDSYCIAKQPRFQEQEKWETNAKVISAAPEMCQVLIEMWYQANDDGKISKKTMKRVESILKAAGAYDEDIW